MRLTNPTRRRGGRGLGVLLLTFSLVHTPLPQPDFHNIRHHDGRGEVCEHHDHLLRWHPGAGAAEDVAILHWHWFLPVAGRGDASATGDGPALHAHVIVDLDATWEQGPRILPDHASRLIGRLAEGSPSPPLALTIEPFAPPPAPVLPGLRSFCATFAPCASLASLLQRWTC